MIPPIPVGTLVACTYTDERGLVIECEDDVGHPSRAWSQIANPPFIQVKWVNGRTFWVLAKDVEIVSFP